MNTQEEKKQASKELMMCQEIVGYTDSALRRIFPNTIFDRGAECTIGACAGLIVGLHLAGKEEMAQSMAETLFRSFHFGMNDAKAKLTEDNWKNPYEQLLTVNSDGCPFSFSFCLWNVCHDQNRIDGMVSVIECPEKNRYNHKYGRQFNGGIILHGLGNQTYSVSFGSKNNFPHWSMHT